MKTRLFSIHSNKLIQRIRQWFQLRKKKDEDRWVDNPYIIF
jgi:hypothetical protein